MRIEDQEQGGLPKTMHVSKTPKRLRIAVVYSRLPFPMMRGDQLTVAHLLSFLAARGHEVDFFCLDAGGQASRAQQSWLQAACREVRIYPHGKLRQALGALQGVLRGLPLQVGIFTNGALARDLRAAVKSGRYDLVYVYYLRSAEVMPDGAPARRWPAEVPSVLAMQLSQTLNTERICQHQTGVLKRLLYGFELRMLRRYETRVWRRFTRTVLIGSRDVEAIRAACRRQNVREIDNWIYGAHGTDLNRFAPARPEEIVPGRVVFSGCMAYQPNVQAIEWFVEHCWPKVHACFPDAELVIQGRDPVPAIAALHGKCGVAVTGTVNEVSRMIRSAAVCINPMLAAGGMQNKLLEYLACGKGVVTTTVANEGIGAQTGKHLLIADTAEEFSDAVLAILSNGALCERLGRAGRIFIERSWSWEAHFLELERNFYELVAQGGDRTGLAAQGSKS